MKNKKCFINNLRIIPSDTVKNFKHPDDASDTWTHLFHNVVDKHIHLRHSKNQPQWLTLEIIEAIKCSDRHKAIGNENQFKL